MRTAFNSLTTHAEIYKISKGTAIPGKKLMLRYTPKSTPTWNPEILFEIPKQGSLLLTGLYLRINLSKLDGFKDPDGSEAGTYVRWVNNIAIRMFESFELWDEGQKVKDVHPDEVMHAIYATMKGEKWEKIKKDIGYGSATERNNAGANAQEFCVDLYHVFDLFFRPFPIHFLNSSKGLTFRFKTQPFDKLYVTDYEEKGTGSITNMFIEAVYTDAPQISRVLTASHNEKMIKEIGKGAEFYGHRFHRNITTIINKDASTTVEVDLDSFKDKNLIGLIFTVHDNADIEDGSAYDETQNSGGRLHFQKVVDFHITDASRRFWYKPSSNITDKEYRMILLDEYDMPNVHFMQDKNIYWLYFGTTMNEEFSHDDGKSFRGSESTYGFKNLKLNITLAETSSAAKRILVYGIEPIHYAIVNGTLKEHLPSDHWAAL